MLKKTIAYTNYNGEEVEEDFYFHLSVPKLNELKAGSKGLLDSMQAMVASTNLGEMIVESQNVILASFGRKTPDGRFIQNKETTEWFESTAAYPVLYMELATDTDAAIEFIRGVVPADLRVQAEAAIKAVGLDEPKAGPQEVRVVTSDALNAMTQEEVAQVRRDLARGLARIEDVAE